MTPEELKKLQEEQNKVWTEMKSVLDQQAAEIKKFGDTAPETKAAIDKLNARLDQIETKLNRPLPGTTGEDSDALEKQAKSAILAYARKGDARLTPDEQKALVTDQDAQGGFLVPVTMRNRIIELVRSISPIRELASVETITSGNTLQIPKEGATQFECGWVGERQARPETITGTFAAESIPVHEMYAKPHASQQMLDDAAFDVEGWIMRKISQRFAQVEGQAFLTGDGVGKPEGILTHPDIIANAVPTKNATGLTPDGLIDLYYSLDEVYASRATWLMRRGTIALIRQMKDPVLGLYIWQPGLTSGAPATILGAPYRECVDMPAVATGAMPILFGDFQSGYQIVDKRGINLLRDPFSSKPFIEFYTTRRTGGQVVLSEAIRAQVVAQ